MTRPNASRGRDSTREGNAISPASKVKAIATEAVNKPVVNMAAAVNKPAVNMAAAVNKPAVNMAVRANKPAAAAAMTI